MRRTFKQITAFLMLVLMMGAGVPCATAQVRGVYDRGAAGLGLRLKRLPTIASALHTGAHPDDEDSGLIAALARGYSARVAYLALNRGEGGQNVIGPELFESLGTIRSEELLQARRLDGGGQFFTSVMDYGFSKKREEAARIWGEKEVLADMVRAIRLYRPLVVIARFTGTPADGHGQHQLSGYLTPQAYRAAADPNAFPEQFKEGLRPWKALKLYVSQSMQANSANPPSLLVNTGDRDPLLGRSYFEIAMEGRSQHKTQEMGTLELRGKQQSGVRLLDAVNKVENEKSVFDGIDTTIRGIAAASGNNDEGLKARLAEIQTIAESAVSQYDAFNPQKLIPVLAKGVKLAREAAEATTNADTKQMLDEKRMDFQYALQMAAGVVVDALSDSETVNPGTSVGVAVRVFAPEVSGIKVLGSEVRVGQGWKSESTSAPAEDRLQGFRPRNEVSIAASFFKVTPPENAMPTQPYWLVSPRKNFTFDWSAAGNAKNRPFQDEEATAAVRMNVGGEEIVVTKTVQYRYADDIRGEIRRSLNVVPRVTNALDSSLIVVPRSVAATTKEIVVSVTNHAAGASAGTVSLDLPDGWKSTAPVAFDLKVNGQKTAATFTVTIPAGSKEGSYAIGVKSTVEGKSYNQSVQEIAYDHIQTHRRYSVSKVDVKVLDLKVAPVNVGYVMGSGDRVPEAIKLLGLPVTMLSEKDLTTGNLSKYDVIVIGIRASQVRPDFVANNGRLLDYVRDGGTMIVQYQQSEYIQNNMLPAPARMDSVVNGTQRLSNLRAVEEDAPVQILVPTHPVFNFPNRITDADFANWVQERHLYSLSQLDKSWVPLLESHDAGEEPINGGMVWLKLGKGNYVYNSYSFFRQLPVGTPGAYRIFANLLSLPKAKGK